MENKLIPGVEKRISAWLDFTKKRENQKYSKPESFTITISRDFGCEGYPLAEALKEKLEKQTKQTWTIFDKLLLDKIQESHQISRSMLKDYGIQSSFVDNLVSMLTPNWDTEKDAFKFIVESIFSVAKEGNVIIVGRGAAVITQNLANCYHFRLTAPMEFRIESITKRMNISRNEANRKIEKNQKLRHKFISKFLKCDVDNVDFYDVVFNNSKSNTDFISSAIIDYINNKRSK